MALSSLPAIATYRSQDPLVCTKTALSPLYGIFVTERSYLLAVRHAAQTSYARALAHRVLQPRLPTELIDYIAEEMALSAHAEAETVWEGMDKKQGERWAKFAGGMVHRHEDGVLVRCVEVTVPRERARVRTRRYAHISMRAGDEGGSSGPSVTVLVPGHVPASGGAAFKYRSAVKVTCRPENGEELSAVEVESDILAEGRVDGLVQLDGVEEAMQAWDRGAVQGFVRKLGLEVVVVPGEDDGLKPRLRLLQAVSWA